MTFNGKNGKVHVMINFKVYLILTYVSKDQKQFLYQIWTLSIKNVKDFKLQVIKNSKWVW